TEYILQLEGAWVRLSDVELPLNPRLIGESGLGKTTLACFVGRRLGREVYIFQCTMDTRPQDLLSGDRGGDREVPGGGRLRRLDAARRSARTGARSVPAPARLRRVEGHRDASAPPPDHRRRVRHVPLCDQLDAVRPAAGRRALPARRGRPLRQPHPPARGRGGGARPAEPPPPPADPPPVGGQGRDAEPP